MKACAVQTVVLQAFFIRIVRKGFILIRRWRDKNLKENEEDEPIEKSLNPMLSENSKLVSRAVWPQVCIIIQCNPII